MAIHDETFHATSKSDNFRSWRSVHLGRENKNKLAFRPNLLRLFATVFKTAPNVLSYKCTEENYHVIFMN